VHTNRGRRRNVRIFEPSRGSDTRLSMPLRIPSFLYRSRPWFPRLLKAALNDFVAEERALDCPEDLTAETTVQSGFYTRRALEGRTSSDRPGR
jgi:hypothetical protein